MPAVRKSIARNPRASTSAPYQTVVKLDSAFALTPSAFEPKPFYTFIPSPSSTPAYDSPPTVGNAIRLPPPSLPSTPESSAPRPRPNRRANPDQPPRPRNAFMIYRSHLLQQQFISGKVERDHRLISRIIGKCWKSMPAEEQAVWRKKADEEKAAHALKYPGYKFSPKKRGEKVKRNVRRNGEADQARCDALADLVRQGKVGRELEAVAFEQGLDVMTSLEAAARVEREQDAREVSAAALKDVPSLTFSSSSREREEDAPRTPESSRSYTSISPRVLVQHCDESVPAFRSPLLAPSPAQALPMMRSYAASPVHDIRNPTRLQIPIPTNPYLQSGSPFSTPCSTSPSPVYYPNHAQMQHDMFAMGYNQMPAGSPNQFIHPGALHADASPFLPSTHAFDGMYCPEAAFRGTMPQPVLQMGAEWMSPPLTAQQLFAENPVGSHYSPEDCHVPWA